MVFSPNFAIRFSWDGSENSDRKVRKLKKLDAPAWSNNDAPTGLFARTLPNSDISDLFFTIYGQNVNIIHIHNDKSL